MDSDRPLFSTAEWKLVQTHKTPYAVQQFLNSLPYNHETDKETLRTLRGVVNHQTAHCLEAALTAAAILEQHGYPSLLLDLASQDKLDHVVFLFKHDDKWGTVGRSRDPGLHGRKPVFRSLRELVDSYAEPFVDLTGRIVGFGVLDLANLGSCDWRLSQRNVWSVQRALIEMPHQRYHMADQRYEFWRNRYCAYRRRYPGRKPTYYANRQCWMAGYPRG